jgi:hypothetical protein
METLWKREREERAELRYCAGQLWASETRARCKAWVRLTTRPDRSPERLGLSGFSLSSVGSGPYER